MPTLKGKVLFRNKDVSGTLSDIYNRAYGNPCRGQYKHETCQIYSTIEQLSNRQRTSRCLPKISEYCKSTVKALFTFFGLW